MSDGYQALARAVVARAVADALSAFEPSHAGGALTYDQRTAFAFLLRLSPADEAMWKHWSRQAGGLPPVTASKLFDGRRGQLDRKATLTREQLERKRTETAATPKDKRIPKSLAQCEREHAMATRAASDWETHGRRLVGAAIQSLSLAARQGEVAP